MFVSLQLGTNEPMALTLMPDNPVAEGAGRRRGREAELQGEHCGMWRTSIDISIVE